METGGPDARGTIDCQMGEEFADFYRDQYATAVRLAWLLTHDHASAEDIAQSAFVRVRPRLDSITHPEAYLRRAIVNECRDLARRQIRSVAQLRLVSAGVSAFTTDQPPELIDAVGRLPYKQRAVIVLRYWADLPEEEIARIIGVRPSTVRSIAARALARLKKELPDDQ